MRMGEKKVDPAWIAKHGEDVEKYVCSMLEAARNAINADGVYNLEGGDFSITLSLASAAYPIAAQFGFEDTEALKKEADEMARRLAVTAQRWHETEQANAKH
ncbi:hypothetical protein DMH08_30705 [Actinomadura sp. WAC 06369]|nr:hypothetical protein DMH08_30705 [Actinomadura sp. WAC 06369]